MEFEALSCCVTQHSFLWRYPQSKHLKFNDTWCLRTLSTLTIVKVLEKIFIQPSMDVWRLFICMNPTDFNRRHVRKLDAQAIL